MWGTSCPYAPYPSSPVTSADQDSNLSIDSREAFDYANAKNLLGPPDAACRGPDDGPQFGELPAGAGKALSLDLQYRLSWLWCELVARSLESYRRENRLEAYDAGRQAQVQAAVPELQALLLPDIERLSENAMPGVEKLISSTLTRREQS